MDPNTQQEVLRHQILSSGKFWFYLLTSLPAGWLVGLRIRYLDENKCVASVPFKWLTKNPFRSMYFAIQCMAAELSTASFCLVAIQGYQPTIAFIIVDLKAQFYKKATDRVYFTSEDGQQAIQAVKKCVASGKATLGTFKTIGKMKDGTIVSEFEFTWSFKQRHS